MRWVARVARWIGRAIWFVVALTYLLVTRLALHGLAAYLALYFTFNTQWFAQQVTRVVSGLLPGRVFVETLEVEPTLVDVVIVQPLIEDGLGRPVISTDLAYATLGVEELFGNIAARAADPEVLPALVLTRARAVRPDVLVEVEPDAWTGIGTAFYDRSKPKTGRGGFHTEIRNATVIDGRVRVVVTGEPYVVVDSAGVNVPIGNVVTERGHTWAHGPETTASGGRIWVDGVALPWAGLVGREVAWDDGVLHLADARFVLSQSQVVLAGGLDNRGRGVRIDAHAQLRFDDDPLLADMLGVAGAGELTVRATGPVDFPQLRAQLDASRLEAGGFSLGPLRTGLEIRLDPWRDVVALDPTVLELDGRPLFVDELVWERAGANDPRDDGAVRVVLRAPELEAPALLALGLEPLPGLDADVRFEARFARPGWRASSQPLWRFDGRVFAQGEARRVTPYPRGAGLGVVGAFSGAVEPDGVRVEAPALNGWLGSNELALDGRFAADGRLDVGFSGAVNLKRLGLAFDLRGLRGTAALRQGHARGPWFDPSARFDLTVARGRYDAWRVETLGARVRFADGLLETRDLTATTSVGRLNADASLHVLENGRLDPVLPLEVSRAHVEGLDVEALLSAAGVRGQLPGGVPSTATVDLDRVRVPLRARDVLGGVEGRARLRVPSARLVDEGWRSVAADVSLARRRLEILEASATSETGAALSARGLWSFPAARPSRFEGTASLTGVDLARFGPLAGRGLSGRVDAQLNAGSGDASTGARGLTLDGELRFSRLTVRDVAFGDARLRLRRTAGDRRVVVDAPEFFPGFSLEKGTAVLGVGGLPEKLAVTVGVSDLDLARFGIGGRRGARLESARVARGSVSVALDAGGGPPFVATVDLPDGAATATVDGVRLANRGALTARTDGRRIDVERAVVTVGPYALAACGAVDLAAGRLDLDVAGALELDDIPGIRRVATGLEGRLVTGGRGGLGGAFDDSCLLLTATLDGVEALGDPKGFVRISDALDAPMFTGAVALEGVSLRPRGLGRDIAVDQGTVRFETKDGVQEIVLDKATPLAGVLEEGTFTVTGRASLPRVPQRRRLEHWLPDRGQLRFRGQDLIVSAPKEYRFTVDPDLTLRFDNLYRPTETERERYGLVPGDRDIRLSGEVDIPEGEYFSGFTVISRALGRVLERGATAGPVKDVTAAVPLLNELRLDLGVHAPSLAIQSNFGVGATDLDARLDLTVRGTYASPLLYGNLTVTDGTVSYNVFKREFEVTEGRLEFDGPPGHPMLDVRAEAAIEVRKQNRLSDSEELEDYAVTVTVKGRVPDYQIAFSSKPSLPEIDVQYLILLGRTKQQLAEEGASGGSLELVSADLSTLVTSLVEAPFVDELVVEPTLGGGGRVEAVLRLGRGIRIGLVGRQETTGARSYDARYRHRLLDQLILEASRRSATETTGERDRYEVQLQYTIPLD